jgi:hypothetical protein
LADFISSSVKSDTALPADAASANLLANKICDVSTEKPTEVGATPEIAAINVRANIPERPEISIDGETSE